MQDRQGFIFQKNRCSPLRPECHDNTQESHTAALSVGGHLPKSPRSEVYPLLAMLLMPVSQPLTRCQRLRTFKAVRVTSSLLYRLCWLRPAFKSRNWSNLPPALPARLPASSTVQSAASRLITAGFMAQPGQMVWRAPSSPALPVCAHSHPLSHSSQGPSVQN